MVGLTSHSRALSLGVQTSKTSNYQQKRNCGEQAHLLWWQGRTQTEKQENKDARTANRHTTSTGTSLWDRAGGAREEPPETAVPSNSQKCTLRKTDTR